MGGTDLEGLIKLKENILHYCVVCQICENYVALSRDLLGVLSDPGFIIANFLDKFLGLGFCAIIHKDR